MGDAETHRHSGAAGGDVILANGWWRYLLAEHAPAHPLDLALLDLGEELDEFLEVDRTTLVLIGLDEGSVEVRVLRRGFLRGWQLARGRGGR